MIFCSLFQGILEKINVHCMKEKKKKKFLYLHLFVIRFIVNSYKYFIPSCCCCCNFLASILNYKHF